MQNIAALRFPHPFDNRAGSDWRIVENDTAHGKLITVNTPNGNTALFLSTAVNRGIPAMAKLSAKISEAAAKIAEIASDTLPSKISEKAEKVIRDIAPAFREGRSAALREAEKLAMDDAAETQLPTTYDNALAQHAISQWSGLTHGERLEAIQTWPDYAVQVIARLGQHLSGLSEEEWDRLMIRRIRTINICKTISPENHNFTLSPSAESPLARGLSEVKVDLHIDDLDRIHEARVSNIKGAEDILRNAVVFASVTLGKTIPEAWNILIGKVDDV